MNTTKKIVMALAVMMVAAAMAAPAAMGAIYTATVCTGQSTSINVVGEAFGDILTGNSEEITPSFDLTNIGDWDAKIEAKFTTGNVDKGLVSGVNDLPASNFELKKVIGGTYTALLNNGDNVEITPQLDDDSVAYNYDAQLSVPAAQPAGVYSGTVVITWSNGATT